MTLGVGGWGLVVVVMGHTSLWAGVCAIAIAPREIHGSRTAGGGTVYRTLQRRVLHRVAVSLSVFRVFIIVFTLVVLLGLFQKGNELLRQAPHFAHLPFRTSLIVPPLKYPVFLYNV